MISIISKGTPESTKIVNLKTGEPFERIKACVVEISVDSISTAYVSFYLPEVEVIPNEFKPSVQILCPVCKEGHLGFSKIGNEQTLFCNECQEVFSINS